ncbi:UDP-glucose 6-dehydrogenase, partial [Saccharothrix sp. ST-888]
VGSGRAEQLLHGGYATPIAEGVPFEVIDCRTAELGKVAANSFRATKISFISAMAEVCESAGEDVVRLIQALAHDDRIGAKFLGAGLGFGGGCLPKDIRAF